MIDFSIVDHGSLMEFTMESEAAEYFVNRCDIDDWQWSGDMSFMVDRRPGTELIESLMQDGYTVTYAD